jgi:3-methyladenine DNA glycosylase/8-oxoguanine DNA glycosylase
VLRLDDGTLRGAGLSRSKLAAIRDLAERAADRRLPTLEALARLDDDDVIEALTQVRGVGPWTVHMLLIFRLGRPDVLPTSDFGVRKGFAQLHRREELPSPAALTAHAERWRPFRSAASWYLWRVLELAPPAAPAKKAPTKKAPAMKPRAR